MLRNNYNATQDKRGLFERFLPTIWFSLKNGSDTHNGFLGAIKNEIDKSNSDIIDSYGDSFLDTAEGVALDKWATTVGLTRKNNEDDEQLRTRIKKYITTERGTISGIISGIKDYFNDDELAVEVYEPYTNIFYLNQSLLNGRDHLQGNYYRFAVIDIHISTTLDVSTLTDIVDKYKAAGVKVFFTYVPSLDGNYSIFIGFDDFSTTYIQPAVYKTFSLEDSIKNQIYQVGDNFSQYTSDDEFTTNVDHLNSSKVLAGGNAGSPNVTAQESVYSESRNLLLGTQDWSGNNWKSNANKTTDNYNGLTIQQTAAVLTSPNYMVQNLGILTVGKKYVFSTYLRNTSDKDIRVFPYYDDKIASGFNYAGAVSLKAHSDWTRVSTLITILANPSTSSSGMRWESTTGLSNGYIQFAGYKLEEGNVLTDWTPAPEDKPIFNDITKNIGTSIKNNDASYYILNKLATYQFNYDIPSLIQKKFSDNYAVPRNVGYLKFVFKNNPYGINIGEAKLFNSSQVAIDTSGNWITDNNQNNGSNIYEPDRAYSVNVLKLDNVVSSFNYLSLSGTYPNSVPVQVLYSSDNINYKNLVYTDTLSLNSLVKVYSDDYNETLREIVESITLNLTFVDIKKPVSVIVSSPDGSHSHKFSLDNRNMSINYKPNYRDYEILDSNNVLSLRISSDNNLSLNYSALILAGQPNNSDTLETSDVHSWVTVNN